MVTKTSRLAAN